MLCLCFHQKCGQRACWQLKRIVAMLTKPFKVCWIICYTCDVIQELLAPFACWMCPHTFQVRSVKLLLLPPSQAMFESSVQSWGWSLQFFFFFGHCCCWSPQPLPEVHFLWPGLTSDLSINLAILEDVIDIWLLVSQDMNVKKLWICHSLAACLQLWPCLGRGR